MCLFLLYIIVINHSNHSTAIGAPSSAGLKSESLANPGGREVVIKVVVVKRTAV